MKSSVASHITLVLAVAVCCWIGKVSCQRFRRGRIRPYSVVNPQREQRVLIQLDPSSISFSSATVSRSNDDENGISADVLLMISRLTSIPITTVHHHFPAINTVVVSVNKEQREELENDTRVIRMERDVYRQLATTASSENNHLKHRTLQAFQDNLILLQIPNVHPITKGSGTKICLVDSGIYLQHSGFNSAQFTGPPDNTNGDITWKEDAIGHGTHVAGIIAAKGGDNMIQGIAPDANVVVVPVLNDNPNRRQIYASDLVGAAYSCISNNSNVQVIYLGFAGETLVEAEQRAFQDIFSNNNVVIVAPSGNQGSDTVLYPAGYSPQVLSVTAVVSQTGQVASFGQRNPMVDLAAPGVNIPSLHPPLFDDETGNNRIITLDGTSLAAAHVAGVALLLRSFQPTATAERIRQVLLDSAQDRGSVVGRDNVYGNGIVQAYLAIIMLNGGTIPQPTTTLPSQGDNNNNSGNDSSSSSTPASSLGRLLINQNTFVQGETLVITIPPENIPGITRQDQIRLYPADVTDFGTPPIRRLLLFQSTMQVETRLTFDETGQFQCVLLVAQSRTPIVIGRTPVFTIAKPTPQTLTLDKATYARGDSITVTIPDTIPGIDMRDNLKLYNLFDGEVGFVPSDNDPPFRRFNLFRSTTEANVRIDFTETGKFQIFICLQGTNIVVAQSAIFDITPPSAQTLQLNQAAYKQGETITITIPRSNLPGITNQDEFILIRANESNLLQPVIIRRIFGFADRNTVSLRITFEELGQFKFVLLVDRTDIVLAQSPNFEISAQSASLSVDKSMYSRGETISVTLPTIPGFQRTDSLSLFPSDTTDFSLPNIRRAPVSVSLTEASTRINFQETGNVRFVLLIAGTSIVLGQTPVFEIKAPMLQDASTMLMLDKLNYIQGETLTVRIPANLPGVERRDDLEIFFADETDFSLPPIRRFFPSPTNAREASTRLDFAELGRLRVMLFVDRTEVILAQSPVFTVSTPASQPLTLDKTTYKTGETISISIPPISGISSRDDVLLFPASQTDFSLPPIVEAPLFRSQSQVSVRIDFADAGQFKFVLLTSGRSPIVLAQSPVFDISLPAAPPQMLVLDKSSYLVGETIDITIPTISSINPRDDLNLFPADQTDFSVSPIQRVSLFGSQTQASARIDFVEQGMFKFVLLVDGTSVALGQSPPFSISMAAIQQLNLNQQSYRQGDTITVTIPNTIAGINSNDVLNLQDSSGSTIRRLTLFVSTSEVSRRIDFTNTGTFQIVHNVGRTSISLAESPTFTISTVVPATLSINKSSFVQGETIVLNIPNSVSFDTFDDLHLLFSDVTDLSLRPVRRIPFFANNGEVSIRINFPETGTFKFVLLVRETTISLAQSPPFTISNINF